MKNIRIVIGLLLVLVVSQGICQAGSGDGALIPVLPMYQEAAYTPAQDPFSGYGPASPPKPADQFYVFWFLGQVISYPVDTAEGLIAGWWNRRSRSTSGGGYAFNPFSAEATRHVPPAPPVIEEQAGSSER